MQLKSLLHLRSLNQIIELQVNFFQNEATVTLVLSSNRIPGTELSFEDSRVHITNSDGIMIKYKSIQSLHKVLVQLQSQPFYPGIESPDNLQSYPKILCLY